MTKDLTTKHQKIPALWFTSKGGGPDELALELHAFAPELDGKIPPRLGIRVRADGLVINAALMVDGGFYMAPEQVAELHRQLGAWLAANDPPKCARCGRAECLSRALPCEAGREGAAP